MPLAQPVGSRTRPLDGTVVTPHMPTGAARSLAEHPLPALVAAGVPVTLATDDPGMFHTDLDAEYRLCHEAFGMDIPQLAEIARVGARAAFCSDEMRTRILAEIDEVVAAA